MNCVFDSRSGCPLNHPGCVSVLVKPPCFEGFDGREAVVDSVTVHITNSVAISITKDNSRRLAVQGDLGVRRSDRRFLDLGLRPPRASDADLPHHGCGDCGYLTGEIASGDRAFSDLLSAVQREREISGPFEGFVDVDGEALAHLQRIRFPDPAHINGGGDVSAIGRGFGNGGRHLMSRGGRGGRASRGDHASEEERSKDHGESRHDWDPQRSPVTVVHFRTFLSFE